MSKKSGSVKEATSKAAYKYKNKDLSGHGLFSAYTFVFLLTLNIISMLIFTIVKDIIYYGHILENKLFGIILTVILIMLLLGLLVFWHFDDVKLRKKVEALGGLENGALFNKLIDECSWNKEKETLPTVGEFTVTSTLSLPLDTLNNKKFEHNDENRITSMYFYIDDTKITLLLTDKELNAILNHKLTHVKMSVKANWIESIHGAIIEHIEIEDQELVKGEQ